MERIATESEPFEEHLEFIETLSNHVFLTFDKKNEKILFDFGFIKDFLLDCFDEQVLETLDLNLNKLDIPCAVIHPSAFEFLAGARPTAMTIHLMPSEMKMDIALILGIRPELIMNKKFILIKAMDNGEFNDLDLIHESSHIIYPSTKPSSLDETYLFNIDEILAFINEILVAQYIKKINFEQYIQHKIHSGLTLSKKPMKMFQYIWDLTSGQDFWSITLNDKHVWGEHVLNYTL